MSDQPGRLSGIHNDTSRPRAQRLEEAAHFTSSDPFRHSYRSPRESEGVLINFLLSDFRSFLAGPFHSAFGRT
jgi:hypothetical protein